MVTSEEIERAERILSIIYEENSTPRQLKKVEVEIADFNNWLVSRTEAARDTRRIKWGQTDPRVHQAYNTLLMHFFLCGLVIGRAEGGTI
jgi:hypothetical protein